MLPSYSTHCSSLLPLSFLQKTIVSEFICDDRVMLPSVFRDLLDFQGDAGALYIALLRGLATPDLDSAGSTEKITEQ